MRKRKQLLKAKDTKMCSNLRDEEEDSKKSWKPKLMNGQNL